METDSKFEKIKEKHKKSLQKAIKEKKIDTAFKPLCEFIAGTKNFFTSSCCSGRILILGLPKGDRKKEAYFHKKWHRKVKFEELWQGLKEKSIGELWFKLEPFILHIGCKTLENAQKILTIMKKAGIKRGGMIVVSDDKILIEFQGTQEMSFPVKKNEKILVEKKFMKNALKRANEKLKSNYLRLEKLEKIMKEELK